MKTYSLSLLATCLLALPGCRSLEEVDAKGPKTGCFSNYPLDNIPWAKTHLTAFQQPKSGPLKVVVYRYEDEPFLAFENPVLSSPMSNIFDCSGTTLAKRGINYNEFTKQAKRLNTLLEHTY